MTADDRLTRETAEAAYDHLRTGGPDRRCHPIFVHPEWVEVVRAVYDGPTLTHHHVEKA